MRCGDPLQDGTDTAVCGSGKRVFAWLRRNSTAAFCDSGMRSRMGRQERGSSRSGMMLEPNSMPADRDAGELMLNRTGR